MADEHDTLPQPADLLAGVNRHALRNCILSVTQSLDAIEPLELQIDTRLRNSKPRRCILRSRTHRALEIAFEVATQWALENGTREKEFAEAVLLPTLKTARQPKPDSPDVLIKVWPLIADLPERTRLAFILVRVNRKSIKKAARIAGVSPYTIKTQLERAETHILQHVESCLAATQPIAPAPKDRARSS